MYTSRVLSWTIAPWGQAARTSSRRRTAPPGAPASRARIRNSVGVRSTVAPPHEAACVPGSSRNPCASTARSLPPRLDQGSQPGDELGEGERLGEVVVPTGGEAGEQVRERVACRQEDHRRADAPGAERLNDVAAVRVGQADVDDERDRIHLLEPAQQLGGGGRRGHLEALLSQAPRHERAQLGIVLEQDHVRVEHCPRSIPPGCSVWTLLHRHPLPYQANAPLRADAGRAAHGAWGAASRAHRADRPGSPRARGPRGRSRRPRRPSPPASRRRSRAGWRCRRSPRARARSPPAACRRCRAATAGTRRRSAPRPRPRPSRARPGRGRRRGTRRRRRAGGTTRRASRT